MDQRSQVFKRISALTCCVCYLFSASLFIIPFVSSQIGSKENWLLGGAGGAYLLAIMFFHFASGYKKVKMSKILGLAFPIIVLGTFFQHI